MNDDKAKIRKGAPRRDPTSYRVERDIVIPAGTILRDQGDGKFGCPIGIGLCTVHGNFSVDVKEANGDISAVLRKVTAA